MVIELWADVVCPWCYIGEARLATALAEAGADGVEVRRRSYQLDPQAPAASHESTVELLQRKYGMTAADAQAAEQRVADLAAAEGLPFTKERVRANTFDAHRVLQLADERGLGEAVASAFYRIHFVDGATLSDHETLVRYAAEAGLDADEVRAVLASDAYADRVAEDGREAAALGANGVPFFVIDRRYGISGAQPAELIAQAIERARGEG